MFVLVGYNFGDQKETEFLGSGNMPKKQGTHAQVCKDSSVGGHAPRKALKVKRIRKGAGKNKPLKAAVESAVATKKGAGGQKKAGKAGKAAGKTVKSKKAANVVTAAELGLGSDSGTPQPSSPTYEPTFTPSKKLQADFMNLAARIDANREEMRVGSSSSPGNGAGAAPEGGREPEQQRLSGKRVWALIFGG